MAHKVEKKSKSKDVHHKGDVELKKEIKDEESDGEDTFSEESNSAQGTAGAPEGAKEIIEKAPKAPEVAKKVTSIQDLINTMLDAFSEKTGETILAYSPLADAEEYLVGLSIVSTVGSKYTINLSFEISKTVLSFGK